VSERGYRGGYNGVPEGSGRTLGNVLIKSGGGGYRAGGSYAGKGGTYNYESNGVYGSAYEPADLGSGGGSENSGYPGGNGGGAIRLEADELALDSVGKVAAAACGAPRRGYAGTPKTSRCCRGDARAANPSTRSRSRGR
jgi:hypothetical protein